MADRVTKSDIVNLKEKHAPKEMIKDFHITKNKQEIISTINEISETEYLNEISQLSLSQLDRKIEENRVKIGELAERVWLSHLLYLSEEWILADYMDREVTWELIEWILWRYIDRGKTWSNIMPIEELKAIWMSVSLREWMSGKDAYNKWNSASEQTKDWFEPKELLKKDRESNNKSQEIIKSFREKQVPAILEAMHNVRCEVRDSNYIDFYKHTIWKPEIAKHLSVENKQHIKAGVFGLATARKRINELPWGKRDQLDYFFEKSRYSMKWEYSIRDRGWFLEFKFENREDFLAVTNADIKSWWFAYLTSHWIPITAIDNEFNFGSSTQIHERKHIEHLFSLYEEENEELQWAKDEILAYLADWSNISDIRDILTDENGLYTYNLIGEEREYHCNEIKKTLLTLKKTIYVHLDVLAILPLKHRKHAINHMELYTKYVYSSNIKKIIVLNEIDEEEYKQEVYNYASKEVINEIKKWKYDTLNEVHQKISIIVEKEFNNNNNTQDINRQKYERNFKNYVSQESLIKMVDEVYKQPILSKEIDHLAKDISIVSWFINCYSKVKLSVILQK